MNYAQGKGWTINIGRSPYSAGYTVELERDGKRTILGNKFGYARSETAERRALREAERLWTKETAATQLTVRMAVPDDATAAAVEVWLKDILDSHEAIEDYDITVEDR